MVPLTRSRGPLRPAILIAALLCGVAAPAYASGSLFGPRTPAADDGRIIVAQNQSPADLMVRIQDLEELVRQLTGRVEGLEFQVTQMQKQAEDNEFRFQQLEGGAPVGKPQAAAPTDGATPSDALPQDQKPAPALNAPMDQLPATPGQPLDTPDLPANEQPMDGSLGQSADPLLNGGSDQLGTLDENGDLANRPLDLSLGGGAISDGDAKAQFEAARDAMQRGDYAFAEDQLNQFVQIYPDDPLVPDAINYLGEALIQRGAYTDAAQVLAEGYTRHKDSNRAPDIMLKLGVALVGADQVEVACRTFSTLAQRYPNQAPAFEQRLAVENQKAQCPVAN
jgi:tol-pal system protein YbgF